MSISETIDNTEDIRIEFIDNSLSKEEKQIIELTYSKAREAIISILVDINIDNIVKITLCLGQIIKILEKITLNGQKVPGKNKKQVALELFRLLLKDIVTENDVKNTIMNIYDTIGENILDTIIDVSKTVNTSINQVIDNANGEIPIVNNASCCINLLTLLLTKKGSP